jgi:hypothetical protein
MSFFRKSSFRRPQPGSFGIGPVSTRAFLRFWRARLLTALFSLAPPAFAADVTVIPPRDYFPTVLKEINAARSSVTVYMFVFALPANASSSKALQLAQALVREVGNVTYGNFKNSVKNDALHDAYAGFWSIMYRLQGLYRPVRVGRPAKVR